MGLYSRVYRVDTTDCTRQDGYQSFDEFFTRSLRPDARPVDATRDAIVSPADGRLDSMGGIDTNAVFTVKGRPYRVGELLGDDHEAGRFAGGTGCVIYLSPRDYHRVHSPVDGTITRIRSLPGDYFPVNSIGLAHVGNLFAINRRVVFWIDTSVGAVAVVMVAAIVVGRITARGIEAHDVPHGDHRFEPPLRIARGDELGVFHLGSTVVLLLDANVRARWATDVGMVRFGARIATAPSHESAHGNGAHVLRYT